MRQPMNWNEASHYFSEMDKTRFDRNERLGQAILNDNPHLCPNPRIYYSEDIMEIAEWFVGESGLFDGGENDSKLFR